DALQSRQPRRLFFALLRRAAVQFVGARFELFGQADDVGFELFSASADAGSLRLDAAHLFAGARGAGLKLFQLGRQLLLDRLRHLAGRCGIAERLTGPGIGLRADLRNLLRQAGGRLLELRGRTLQRTNIALRRSQCAVLLFEAPAVLVIG